MRARPLTDEAGYSLVEVMASMVILALAIIPMAGMFDAGLDAATRGGRYDKARAFANERLERARVLPYGEVRENFPVPGATLDPGGVYSSPDLAAPASAGLPAGSTYAVTKRFVRVPAGPSADLQGAAADSYMMRLTVSVRLAGGGSITVSGVVSGGPS